MAVTAGFNLIPGVMPTSWWVIDNLIRVLEAVGSMGTAALYGLMVETPATSHSLIHSDPG
jgi:hypothetical protein